MKEDELKNTTSKFGKKFFDSGRKKPGIINQSYKFGDRYPVSYALANLIKKYFNPKKVLDLGCAKGFLVKAFRDINIEAWGVDISEYAISNSPNDVTAFLYDLDLNKDTLPFEDSYFDFITIIGTIEYLEDCHFTISEIKRVLKKGGSLYLMTLYKTTKRDKFRINAHERSYWIKEFKDDEFRFSAEMSKLLSEELFRQLFENTSGKGIKFKIGKFLFRIGGKRVLPLLILANTIINKSGIFIFVKE